MHCGKQTTQGVLEPSAAMKKEMELAAAALTGAGGGDGADASAPGGCGEALRMLVAPPGGCGAACVPRGPSYYFGCSFAFSPMLAGPRAAAASSGGNGGGEYWRQLGAMLLWQSGMLVFGLLVVTMIAAAGGGGRASAATAADFAAAAWAARAAPANFAVMAAGFALYLLVGFNAAMGYPTRMRRVREAGVARCQLLAVLSPGGAWFLLALLRSGRLPLRRSDIHKHKHLAWPHNTYGRRSSASPSRSPPRASRSPR